MKFYALLATSALALAAPLTSAHAQQTDQADSVVVIGREAEEMIKDFVGEIAITGQSADQLARWDRTICPSMIGLRGSYAQLVVDQIARRAYDVGLDVGKPGCKANILIIVSMDPDAAAQALFDNYKRRLGYFDGPNTLGRNALKAFVDSQAPVRWWHVNYTVTADGKLPKAGESPINVGKRNLPTVTLGTSSMTKRATRENAGMSFLIVDGRRLQGMDLSALADYLAMASLAQIDPEADTSGHATILNLFKTPADGKAQPVSMTDWDTAYLGGLYSITGEGISAKTQANEIARSMSKDLAAPD